MATRLATRSRGGFASPHVHRVSTRKRGSDLWTVAVVVLCAVVLGLTSVLVFQLNQRWIETAASAERDAAAPLRPEPPRRSSARPPNRKFDRRGVRSRDSGLPQFTKEFGNGAAPVTPWRAVRSSNPFQGEEARVAESTIDKLVFWRLAELDIEPATLCSDEVLLRRVYLDVLGTLPTPDEARRFLDDPAPDKRARLIDQTLERSEFADYQAMKWCDLLRVKAEFPIKLWPNAAQAYHRWIRTAISTNLPYDEFARELLTSSGSNFRAPQVNFYRAVQAKEPKSLAQAVAQTFLGERAEQWPTERLEGMSVFFSQVGYKPTGEWKEEIVLFDRRKGKEKDSAHAALVAVFPNGAQVEIPPGEDPRRVFAEWLIDEKNPWFARVMANRVWCWLLGRGIVDPPDDFREDNPPSNPELLDHLASELTAAGYDVKHVYRLILNSQTYQLSSIPANESSKAEENFAHYPVRRLDAEVLIDAICQITGTSESYMSIIPEPYTFLPEGTRAIALPDGSITSAFLEMFGRPPRDTGLESERNNRLTAAQALHLLNSNHIRNKLKQGPGLADLLSSGSDPVESLYLAILSRRPTDEERNLMAEMGEVDAAWALINCDEFLFRH